LARETLKDPYIFDFLRLSDDAQERDIERALTQHITRFLIELGADFAFVGRQYRLKVGGDEFFIDLLFYHLKLRCYVVVSRRPPHLNQ
jgi:predicted nuclease of restriction endonuclease-like (RecB) superfamily